jgi:mannose-6-phosphate isomerase-like protein (cupin superfamily)
MIEFIKDNGKILSIVIRTQFSKDGVEFFTPDDFSQQLAYMKYQKGHSISPHVHNIVTRSIDLTQEVLFIKSGKVRVDFYRDDKSYFESRILFKGDVVLLAHGGHGLELVEESEIIEVKQGPYAGENDKTRFSAIANSEIKIKD